MKTTTFTIIAFSLINFVFPVAVRADVLSCRSLFPPAMENFRINPKMEIGSLNKDFKHSLHIDFEQATTKIKSQCSLASCWIHAHFAAFETRLLQTTGRTYNFNENHLMYAAFQERIEWALNDPKGKVYQAGMFQEADSLVNKYGLLPESVWTPNKDITAEPLVSHLTDAINNRIYRFREESEGKTDEQIQKLREYARLDLQDLMDYMFGTPPESFQYYGQTFTPKSFYEYIQKSMQGQPVIHSLNIENMQRYDFEKSKPELKESGSFQFPRVKFYETRMKASVALKEVADALQAGKQVTALVEWDSKFVDDNTGVASIAAFNFPADFRAPSMRYRDMKKSAKPGHVIQVVGFEKDPATGEILKLKVKNSWGSWNGNEGFYYLYRDFIEEFGCFFAIYNYK